MKIIVQKFGGTSLATIAHIKRAAEKVIETKLQGFEVAVVVSAMAKETDRLLALSAQLGKHSKTAEVDVLATSGETVSAALMSLALQSLGYSSRSFLGHQLPILTNSDFNQARIENINPEPLLQAFRKNEIPVIAGFQGVTHSGRLTTLGRGGSDTTAVAIAAALKGAQCEIYTDVDGVFSADPKVCPEAKLLPQVSYPFMIEAATLGAKVMHDRSVEFGLNYNVPITVKNSYRSGKGTSIGDKETGVRCITLDSSEEANKVSVVGSTLIPYRNVGHAVSVLTKNRIPCLGVATGSMSFSCYISKKYSHRVATLFHSAFINKESL
jgi:aspartate kinase